MRITKWVDMGQEVDIDIGVDDITAAISEAFAKVSEAERRANHAFFAINKLATCLKAITDEHIAPMNDVQRKAIGDFLREQAKRYAMRGAA